MKEKVLDKRCLYSRVLGLKVKTRTVRTVTIKINQSQQQAKKEKRSEIIKSEEPSRSSSSVAHLPSYLLEFCDVPPV
jgi:hypothetical protein